MTVSKKKSSSSSSSSNKNNANAFYLANTVRRASFVRQAVCGHFRFRTACDIVFFKETSIELVIVGQDASLVSLCDQPVFSTIKDLALLPWNDRFQASNPEIEEKDMLLVISDMGKLSFLYFCNKVHRFLALTHIPLFGPEKSRNHVGKMLAVDSTGCFVAASAYEDQLTLFSLVSPSSDITYKRIFFLPKEDGRMWTARASKSISGTIWSMCFISKDYDQECKPVLAILLHRNGALCQNELLLFQWNIKEQTIDVVYRLEETGPLAHHVVEVPHSDGLALIFKFGDIDLMDFRNPYEPSCVYRASVDNSEREDKQVGVEYSARKLILSYVCSWSWEPCCTNRRSRIIFCADSGDFYSIELTSESNGIKVELSDSLYKSLQSNVLLWLHGGFLAAITDISGGMVLKFEEGLLQYKRALQNIAPILDMCCDFPDGEEYQMFACSGMTPDGSLWNIRDSISVEKLFKRPHIYEGVTGTWTIKMKVSDPFHSFLVLTFLQNTRVLSVGMRFSDATEAVCFLSDVCTLACGLVADGVLVQIHQRGVRFCLLDSHEDPAGNSLLSSKCISFLGDKFITLGAVGEGIVAVATATPCVLLILGFKAIKCDDYEVNELHQLAFQHELSCISIPQEQLEQNRLLKNCGILAGNHDDKLFVIGTRKPSVEVVLSTHNEGLRVLAIGTIRKGIPTDVRLVIGDCDCLYVLSGLRNGKLLKFKWPIAHAWSTPVVPSYSSNFNASLNAMSPYLQLIAECQLGNEPVFLVSLSESLDADVIALSDRPWLVLTAICNLAYKPISFQAATLATPVCFHECPKGILFVAENKLHLVKMVATKKIHLGGTPTEVLYHHRSGMFIVMRRGLSNEQCSSDICFVDPRSDSVLSAFEFEAGETGKSMDLIYTGTEQVLVVGTRKLKTQCRLLVFRVGNSSINKKLHLCKIGSCPAEQPSSSSFSSCAYTSNCVLVKPEEWDLQPAYSITMDGVISNVCPFLDTYFLVARGNQFGVYSFVCGKSEEVKLLAAAKTSFDIVSLTARLTRVAVVDCQEGLLFFTYDEGLEQLKQVYHDPVNRLVANSVLIDVGTAFVSERNGVFGILSCVNPLEDSANQVRSLTLSSSYYMGEIATSFKKRSFHYKLPADDVLKNFVIANNNINLSRNCIMASTLSGSIVIFTQLTREEYELLKAVQARLVVCPSIAPILGNNHDDFRSHGSPAGTCTVLDSDILRQYFELPSTQQMAVLAFPSDSPCKALLSLKPPHRVKLVVQLLQRLLKGLN